MDVEFFSNNLLFFYWYLKEIQFKHLKDMFNKSSFYETILMSYTLSKLYIYIYILSISLIGCQTFELYTKFSLYHIIYIFLTFHSKATLV